MAALSSIFGVGGKPMNTTLVFVSKTSCEAQVYWIASSLINWDSFKHFLVDSVDTELWINPRQQWSSINADAITLLSFKAGVTDNPGRAFKEMLLLKTELSSVTEVRSGLAYWAKEDNGNQPYQNPLIHDVRQISVQMLLSEGLDEKKDKASATNSNQVDVVEILGANATSLRKMSDENCWALSLDEMHVIQKHYEQNKIQLERKKRGLPKNPTDVEMEVFAQTWSEHCKHKIFNAKINYTDANESFVVDGIYPTYIKALTKKLDKPWAVSVFKDNAGVVSWNKNDFVCIKVETHNSPSALDPYGGALTGILGVNRDVLGCGLGFKPIANTNVLCFGHWDEKEELPSRLLHPQKIMRGVHRGIQDGGNKSGIPTVNGAFVFDENYSGKPLVFCGTVGVAPKNIPTDNKTLESHQKYTNSGDLIVMVGGRVGLDGIHGATASSLALDESTPTGMVQIGDPLTQKRMVDFILEARDLGLFTSITDNGAGGLSSSVGEMAQATNGAEIDLSKVPLKYCGLRPWQILVSESQERMTLAIAPEKWDAFKNLALKRQCEVSHIGTFTSSGLLEVFYGSEIVGLLDLHFLHEGLPQMSLSAHFEGAKPRTLWKKIQRPKSNALNGESYQEILKKIVADRTLASKEEWIRQFDHEVQAATVVKPFEGVEQTSPNNAGVVWLKNGSWNGIAVASGLCPQFSFLDTELMAKLAVDECVRNLLCHGARLDQIALLDNFCWPDPLPGKNNPDAKHKLAQLVRAARGLHDICLEYEMPLISGKDSMKNDYKDNSVSISIDPTLLVTGIGYIEDVRQVPRSFIPDQDLYVYEIGLKSPSSYFGMELSKYFIVPDELQYEFDLGSNFEFYKKLNTALANNVFCSVHDISEGGLLFSLFESLLGKKLGINLDLNFEPSVSFLFGETPGRFVVSISESKHSSFKQFIPADSRRFLGKTSSSFKIKIDASNEIDLHEIEKAWRVKWN